MDLSTVTDIKELKALAYDQLLLQQQAETNLRMITQRMEQLNAEQNSEKVQKQPKKSDA